MRPAALWFLAGLGAAILMLVALAATEVVFAVTGLNSLVAYATYAPILGLGMFMLGRRWAGPDAAATSVALLAGLALPCVAAGVLMAWFAAYIAPAIAVAMWVAGVSAGRPGGVADRRRA